LRAAQFAGVPLETQRAITARRVIEFAIEKIGAEGSGIGGLKGLLNHPNVPLYAPDTGSWATATAEQMLEDLHSLVDQVISGNKETFYPDTMVLDGESRRLIARKHLDTVQETTVLAAFLKENDYIKTVESWNRCEDADAAGTGPRFVCYKRSPEVLVLDIPQEFESFPPQAKNLSFFVPCHARVGGVKIRYPLAVGYMDGC
jgi:hypothetical protein